MLPCFAAVAKARTLDVDGVILDLEDAVSPSSKVAARELLASHLAGAWGDRSVAIRVNGRGTPWYEDDLRAVARLPGCAAVILPKVESFSDIVDAGAVLRCSNANWDVPFWAMVETPRGILEAGNIAREATTTAATQNASVSGTAPRGLPLLECLVAGTSDLTAALGARHEPGRQPLLTALSTIVMAARAYGLRALDGVCLQVPSPSSGAAPSSSTVTEGFAEECKQGRAFGFHGKTLIHPSQVQGANDAFGPSAAEVAAASRILGAYEEAVARGAGIVVVDGRLVEILHIHEAKAVLEFARLLESRASGAATGSAPTTGAT